MGSLSTPPFSFPSSAEISHQTHIPRNFPPLPEVGEDYSSDPNSDEEVMKKLSHLVERRTGITSAGNRDTIDSILSKYEDTSEAEQNNHASNIESLSISGVQRKDMDKDSVFSHAVKHGHNMEAVSTPDHDIVLQRDHEESRALHCPHCDEDFHARYIEDTARMHIQGENNGAPSPSTLNRGNTVAETRYADVLEVADSSTNQHKVSSLEDSLQSSDLDPRVTGRHCTDRDSGYWTQDSNFLSTIPDTLRDSSLKHRIFCHLLLL